MSFKLDNITWRQYQKNIFQKLSFSVNDEEILGVFFDEYKDHKYLIKLLQGKKKIVAGNIFYNDQKITGLIANDRSFKKITLKKLHFKILPVKFRAVSNLLFNPHFLTSAYHSFLMEKYNYLFCQYGQGIKNKTKLINEINVLLENFTNDAFNIKEEWTKDYLINVAGFNRMELEKLNLFADDKSSLEALINFCDKKQLIFLYENYLEFLQALWDKIDFISDSYFSCLCGTLKKVDPSIKQHLDNKVISLVCNKYKKMIGNKIFYYRYKIWKEKRTLKKYSWQFLLTLSLKNKNYKLIKKIIKGKHDQKLKDWYKLLEDIQINFLKKQNKIITTFFPLESGIIKDKIVSLNHHFHQQILSNKKIVFYNNKKELLAKKKLINNIFNVAFTKVNNTVKLLGLKINWFKWTKNLSNFDYLQFQLLSALLAEKKIIVIYSVFFNLTRPEIIELGSLITKIKINYPKTAIIILTKNIELVKNCCNLFLLFSNDRQAKLFSYNDSVTAPVSLQLYNKFYASGNNIFKVKYNLNNSEFQFTEVWEKIKFSNSITNQLIDQKTYLLALNPSKILLSNVEYKNKVQFNAQFQGNIIAIKKNSLVNIVIFQTLTKAIIFVSVPIDCKLPKINKKIIVYLSLLPEAILVYEEKTEKLLAKI